MGHSCASVSIRDVPVTDIVDLLQTESPRQACFVNSRGGRWVSVIGKSFMVSNEAVEATGMLISKELKQPSIGFRVIDSDIFCYWVFDKKGILVDRSCPADIDDPTEEEAKGRAGDPKVIAEVFDEGISRERMVGIFQSELYSNELIMYLVAGVLKMDADFPWSYESLAARDLSPEKQEIVRYSIHRSGRRNA